MGFSGATAYAKVNASSGVENADPHLLIQMLIDGSIEKLNRAKFFLNDKNTAQKGTQISWAISIIGGLKASLDMQNGGDIANNLSDLYDYCTVTLAQANVENDEAKIDSVLSVLNEIKIGWDGIREESLQMTEKTNA